MNKIVGQTKLIEQIDYLVDNDKFSRFTLLVGQKGSGKHLISSYIGKQLGMQVYILDDIKVATIREMIADAYRITEPTLYLIFDGDRMSLEAKNALLKVTEEPPQNAYFIMTLESLSNTLDTIKSRASVLNMDIYSILELKEYAESFEFTKEEESIVLEIADTPFDIQELSKIDILSFYAYVTKVVDNIATVSGSNAFKIGDKIAFKGESDQYDLALFLRAFMLECKKRITTDIMRYSDGIMITSATLNELRNPSINRQNTFDIWLLNIRKKWL